jgi:hypothetical protein
MEFLATTVPTATLKYATRGLLILPAVVLGLAILLGPNTAAANDTIKYGNQYCYTSLVGIHSYAIGEVYHYSNNLLQASWFNSTWRHRDDVTSHYTSTPWDVYTTGGLSDPGTYAYCSGIGE